MKRIICFCILLSAFVVSGQAQNFKAGLTIGVTPSQVDGDYMGGYNKIGLTAGAYIKWDQTDKLFFQSDLLFTMKGSKQASSKSVDFSRIELSTNYIDWVLSCGYKVMDRVSLKAGIVPSVLISSKQEYTGGGEVIGGLDFRRFNLLVTGGVGYELSEHFSVAAAYNYSIVSIREGKSEIVNLDIKTQNAQFHSYISLCMSYQF